MTRTLDQIPVAYRTRAFDGPVHRTRVVRDGERWPTIAEIVAETPHLPARFIHDGEVRINGDLVPRERWHLVRPKLATDREVAITLHIRLRGGGGQGGGQKNIIALVATIAVLLVAAAVTGGLLGPVAAAIGLPFSLAAGTIGASVAGAAVGLVGALAIAALTPAPKLAAAAEPGAPTIDADGKPASLTGNVLAPGAAAPRVLGTRRLFPPLAGQPLPELVGDNEVVEGVYVLAGPHALSLVRAGDIAAADISEMTVELQDGTASALTQSLVPRQSRTIANNLLMSQHALDKTTQYLLDTTKSLADALPKWESVVSRDSPDEIWVRLAWHEGLFQESAPTGTMNHPVRVRIRRRGDSTWINLPEIHFSSNKPIPFQKDIRIKWATIPAIPNAPPTNQGPVYAFKSVPGQDGVFITPVTAGWSAHSHFSGGAGNDVLSSATLASSNVRNVELHPEKVVFYLSAATFPQDAQYEIQIRRASPYIASNFNPANYQYATVVRDWFEYQGQSGQNIVPIDLGATHDRLVVRHVSSIWNENPIQSTDFATVSVKVRGRALEQISVLASGYVYDWDGSGWNTLTTTSNPAPHFRDVLGGTLSADPMPADMIDDAGLVAWRTHCVTMGYTIDAVVDGHNAKDVLELIAACGYARPRMSEKWGVAVDKDRSAESPVQIFSPRNMRGFGFARGFPQMPSGFRVRFDNIDNDYHEDEIIVDDVDLLPDQPTRYEQVRYDGFVDENDARARALFDLEQARRRFVFYRGEVPVEALVCVRGDLVGVQHDVIRDEGGYARVIDVKTSGSNVTGLILDGSIPVPTEDAWSDPAAAWSSYSSAWAAARTGIAIRLNDQTSIIKEVTAVSEETNDVDFVTPFSNPGASILAADCLVVAGKFGSEYQRMLVLDVTPIADMAAAMTFVPEAPELWN